MSRHLAGRRPQRASDPSPATPPDVPEVPCDLSSKLTLGQFLKLANLIESGAEAKTVLAEGEVRVNGEQETRRGRGLADGDVVDLGGNAARVVATSPHASPDAAPRTAPATASPETATDDGTAHGEAR